MTEGPDQPDQADRPEFGPSGYLPEKAARRARKIVLRAPLGLQWIVGSIVAGIVIVAVAVVFLARSGDPPGPPFREVATVAAVGDALQLEERGALVLAAAGRVRTFVVAEGDEPAWCAASRRLESSDGRVWAPTGRALDGGPSLDEHPTLVVRGVVYVDFSRVVEGPAPDDVDPSPACG
ncbi:MAG: hypothetical protein ACRDUY_06360 [Nitriliruptorales bacterium]